MRVFIRRALLAILVLAILGCGLSGLGQDPPPPSPPPVVISEGPGGGANVQVNGHAVWPPTGPGCDRYVACCDAAGATNTATQLMCQLTAAEQSFNCASGLNTIRSYLEESHAAIPAACAP